MTAEKILTTSRSRSLGTVSDRVVARHEIGERIIISRGFCLENQTFSFQYPFSGAFLSGESDVQLPISVQRSLLDFLFTQEEVQCGGNNVGVLAKLFR